MSNEKPVYVNKHNAKLAQLKQTVRSACNEMVKEIEAVLPKGSTLQIRHVSDELKTRRYKLARAYNPAVCNGLTFAVIVHPTTVDLFVAICDKEDQFSRIDGRHAVLARVYEHLLKTTSKISPQAVSYTDEEILYPGLENTTRNRMRGSINAYIEDNVNVAWKKKKPVFQATREQVLTAETALATALKELCPHQLDYRLIYQHQHGNLSEWERGLHKSAGRDLPRETTTLKVVVAKSEHNNQVEHSIITTCDAIANELTVTVQRHPDEPDNRLNARYFAIKAMAKKIKLIK